MRITFKGNGVVWDAGAGKNLCKFEGGKFENGVWIEGLFTTDVPRTIELLKDYPTVPASDMDIYWKEKEEKEEAEKAKAEQPVVKKKPVTKKKAE